MKRIPLFKEQAQRGEERATQAKRLNEENRAYFKIVEDLLFLKVHLKNIEAIQKQVNRVLTDLIQAQNNGESAQDHFGCSATELANQLLRQAKTRPSIVFFIVAPFSIIGVVWYIVYGFMHHRDIWDFVVNLVIVYGMLVISFIPSLVFKFVPFQVNEQQGWNLIVVRGIFLFVFALLGVYAIYQFVGGKIL